MPGFGKPLLLCSLFGLLTITTLNCYGASLTLTERRRHIQAGRPTLARRMVTLIVSTAVASQYRARLDGEFRREIRGISRRASVPVHALDGDQSGGFLLGAARTLFGA
jgi:hypothetical protein